MPVSLSQISSYIREKEEHGQLAALGEQAFG
jgi:hypothetical protein